MRRAANSSASRCAAGTLAAAFSRSAWAMRKPLASTSTLSNFFVYSSTAASPRERTSAMMSATMRSTFSSVSRLRPRKAENSPSNPGAEASSLSGPIMLPC